MGIDFKGRPTVNGVGISTSTDFPAENLLINGSFQYWQPGGPGPLTSATVVVNNDDTYMCDQWILLSSGNDIVDVSRSASETHGGDNSAYAIALDVETANQKFGIFQPLEYLQTRRITNKATSVSFRAKTTGSSLNAIRVGIVSWTSTADAITSDIVSAWNAAGSNPTLATNWAFVNTPGALTALSNTYQTYTLENVVIPSNARNVGLFIWLDDTTTTVADFLYINEVMWNVGINAASYYADDPSREILRCQRYYEKTFNPDVVPTDDTANYVCALTSAVAATSVVISTWQFKAPKRTTPSVTLYNPRNGANGQWTDSTNDLANASTVNAGFQGVQVTNSDTAVGNVNRHYIHAAADARL